MSGPRNFTHQRIKNLPKLERFQLPSVYEILLGSRSEFSLVQLSGEKTITPANVGKSSALANCTADCVVKRVFEDQRLRIWGYSYLMRADNPPFWWREPLEGLLDQKFPWHSADIYISGKGGDASLCSFEEHWWIVFGVRNGYIHLHNILDEGWVAPSVTEMRKQINARFDLLREWVPTWLAHGEEVQRRKNQ